jgi:hypothetical protein
MVKMAVLIEEHHSLPNSYIILTNILLSRQLLMQIKIIGGLNELHKQTKLLLDILHSSGTGEKIHTDKR